MFDYTQFQAFLQIVIELCSTFLILDRYHFLFRLQQGIISDLRDANQRLESNVQYALMRRISFNDIEWLKKKGRLRATDVQCRQRLDVEDNPQMSAFWNSFAPPLSIISIIMCMFLLYAIAETKTYESKKMIDIILLTMQSTLIPICIIWIYYHYTRAHNHPYRLIVIAAIWELIAILLGVTLGLTGWSFGIIETHWVPTLISIIVWLPLIPLIIYICNLLYVVWMICSNYHKLEVALNDFNKYNNKILG